MNFSFKYNGEQLTGDEKGICKGNLKVTAEINMLPEYDAEYWTLWFENTGESDTKMISDIWDCDMLLHMPQKYERKPGFVAEEGIPGVVTMQGMVPGSAYTYGRNNICSQEYKLINEYFFHPDVWIKRENVGARSSNGTVPFFDIHCDGEGVITAIGWTGDWKAEFNHTDPYVTMRSGLKYTEFYLKPGEKIRTSSTLLMHYKKGEDKHNKFRRLIKNHFSHVACAGAAKEGILAFELWGGLSSEEMIKRIGEMKHHGLIFDEVWLDAGWYGQCKNCETAFNPEWSNRTGEWEVNLLSHPDGLKDVQRAIEDAGMRMMLWLEPERATEFVPVVHDHPEMFLSMHNASGRVDLHRIVNLGTEQGYNYVLSTVSEYIHRFNLSVYRQDFNVDLTEFFKQNDEENRRGITEIKYIMGLYRFWEALTEKHPGLIIDNCSSGGRRVDIETLKRTNIFFRSDFQCMFNADPDVLQTVNTNCSAYFPYIGCTTKEECNDYDVRSAYASSFGGAYYNAVFQTMDEGDFKWAVKSLNEYKRISRYFSGDFYNHGSSDFDKTSWAIWQYHDPDSDSGIVMAFRRAESPFESVNIALKGCLKSGYTFENFDTEEVFTGSTELKLVLPEKRTSTIIYYR